MADWFDQATTAPQQPARRGRVITDPFRANADRRAEEDQSFEAERLRLSQQAEQRASAALQAQIQNMNKPPAGYAFGPPSADGTPTLIAIPGGPADSSGRLTSEQRGKIADQYKTVGNLAARANEMRELFDNSFKGRNPLEGLGQHVRFTREVDRIFNDAAGSATAYIATALGLSGQQFNTPVEQQLFIGSILPRAGETDGRIANKLDRLDGLIADARASGRRQLGLTDENDPLAGNPEVMKFLERTQGEPSPPGDQPDRTPSIPGGGGAGQNLAIAEQGQRFSTEADNRFQALAQQAFERGATRQELDELAARFGYMPYGADLDAAIQFRNQGGQGAAIAAPQSGVTNLTDMNRIAGSPAAELGRSYLNGLTAGFLDEGAGAATALLTGRPLSEAIAEADLQKRLGAEAHPTANLIGNVAGGLTGLVGVPAAVGRVAPSVASALMSSRTFSPAAIGFDAAYGGLYGAGENNADRTSGAWQGALASAGGGMAGRGLLRGAGNTLTGVRSAVNDELQSRGINLTVGQALGGRGKAFEDKLTSAPVLGDLITNRQTESINDFNRAAFRELSPAITETGSEGIQQARTVINDAYDQALAGKVFELDTDFARAIEGANALGSRIPGRSDDFAYMMERHVNPNIAENLLTGKGLQAALKGIRQDRRSLANQPRGTDFSDAAGLVEQALLSVAERGAPGTASALAEANRLYGMKRVLEDAVLKAEAQGGTFTPNQLGRSSIQNTRRFGGATRAAEGDRPFYELTRAGQDVLPSKIGNSYTTDRAAVLAALAPFMPGFAGGSLAASGVVDPSTAVYMALAGVPATRTGQRAIVQALTRRPEGAVRAGEAVRDNATVAGALAAPLALQYLGN